MEPDKLVDAYIQALDPQHHEYMGLLCATVLYPTARRIVRAKLDRYPDDVEDVVQDAVSRLALELQKMRGAGNRRVGSVVGWTVGSAVNACQDFFRKEHWLRTQVANAVRYIVKHSTVFRMWWLEGRPRIRVCGWRRCVGARPLTPAELAELMDGLRLRPRSTRLDPHDSRAVWRALARILALANGSVYYSLLVAAIWEAAASPSTIFATVAVLPDLADNASADEFALQRSLLHLLWKASMGLPQEQRLALFLKLRGNLGLKAFWEFEVVAKEAVAESLCLPAASLDELPWTDLQIADHIEARLASAAPGGVIQQLASKGRKHRQQAIINWRRAANLAMNAYLSGSGPDQSRP